MTRKCQHCRARLASETWDLTACALGKRITARLCTQCDIELNELTLRFVRHPGTDAVLAAYRSRKQQQEDRDAQA